MNINLDILLDVQRLIPAFVYCNTNEQKGCSNAHHCGYS